MRRIIRLGALAAALVTALGGGAAGSASATVLCTSVNDAAGGTPGIQCPTASLYTGDMRGYRDGTTPEGTFTSTTILGTIEIKCTAMPMRIQVSDSGGADGVPNGQVTVADWKTWTDANSNNVIEDGEENVETCPITGVSGAATASFAPVDMNGGSAGYWDMFATWTSDTASAPNGRVTLQNIKIQVTINLGTPEVCNYVGDENQSGDGSDTDIVGEVYNRDNGDKVHFNGVGLRRDGSSGICPQKLTFTGTYTFFASPNLAYFYLRDNDA